MKLNELLRVYLTPRDSVRADDLLKAVAASELSLRDVEAVAEYLSTVPNDKVLKLRDLELIAVTADVDLAALIILAGFEKSRRYKIS